MGDTYDVLTQGGEEDMETDYLQDMSHCDSHLEHSMDSSKGSATFPTFSLGQSTELQGSQGFQVVNPHMDPSVMVKSENEAWDNQIGNVSNSGQSSTYGPLVFNTGKGKTNSAFVLQGTLNVVSVEGGLGMNQIQLMTSSSGAGFETINVLNPAGETVPDNTDKYRLAESGDTSSDEKSGKCKSSPKRHGRRKSRSSSSMATETAVKSEPLTGPSPSRGDGEQVFGSDFSFKPSLLEEILSEKKMALMKSPEVIQFLQNQQERLATEKKLSSTDQSPTNS